MGIWDYAAPRVQRGCVVCEVFPGHRGSHYAVRDVATFIFSHRCHSRRKDGWTALSGCTTSEGRPIVVSTHMSNDPDALSAEGLWLREEREYLESEPLKPRPRTHTSTTFPAASVWRGPEAHGHH